jgi:hypothetical protein
MQRFRNSQIYIPTGNYLVLTTRPPADRTLRTRHPFHILPVSPYPVMTAFFLFFWLLPQVFYLHSLPFPILPRATLIHLSFVGLFLTVMRWFYAIIQESGEGYHTRKVQHGLRMGMLLFIVSEVMFFFAFF